MKGSGLVEAEGTGCTKRGRRHNSKRRVGCRIRDLAAHLCSGFVMGKITRNYYGKFQTLLAMDFVSLIIVHLGNGVLKV